MKQNAVQNEWTTLVRENEATEWQGLPKFQAEVKNVSRIVEAVAVSDAADLE